jgi:NhaP-type Na+/H+ or K+/H+ antiporter
MLVIGVILRNVPYNFSQTQRPECLVSINDTEMHVDSINMLTDGTGQNNVSSKSLGDIMNITASSENPMLTRPTMDDSCKPRYIGRDLDPAISGICRATCLAVILLLAGLELDPVALPKLAGLFVSGTVFPCVVELVTATLLARFILGFDWLVAAILGVLLTGISAAVVIPSLVSLTNAKYGVAKGIPTLSIACCASTDAFAIAGMGILTGIYFNNKDASLARLILQGPIEIIVGFLFGFLWGGIVQYLPDKNHHNLKFFRWLLLFCGGLISIFGSKVIEYEGAGGVATVVGAYIANKKWRELGWEEHNDTEKNIKKMWIVLSPVIFGLVGTEVQIDKLNGTTVGLGFAVLVITVVIRTITAFFSMWSTKFTWKEMLFLALSWVPKATVQAALGKIIFINSVENSINKKRLV